MRCQCVQTVVLKIIYFCKHSTLVLPGIINKTHRTVIKYKLLDLKKYLQLFSSNKCANLARYQKVSISAEPEPEFKSSLHLCHQEFLRNEMLSESYNFLLQLISGQRRTRFKRKQRLTLDGTLTAQQYSFLRCTVSAQDDMKMADLQQIVFYVKICEG